MLPPERDDDYFARHEVAVAEAVVRRELAAVLQKHRDDPVCVLLYEVALKKQPGTCELVATQRLDGGGWFPDAACAQMPRRFPHGTTVSPKALLPLLVEHALALRQPLVSVGRFHDAGGLGSADFVRFDYGDTYLRSRTVALLRLFEERAANGEPIVQPSDWTDLVPEMEYLCRRWDEVGASYGDRARCPGAVAYHLGALTTLLMCVRARCCEERFYLERVAPHECERLRVANPALFP